jgi:hypothetical protein
MPDFYQAIGSFQTRYEQENKKHNNLACGIVEHKMPSLHFNSEAVDAR